MSAGNKTGDGKMNEGDTVRLKSGGPTMTVEKIEKDSCHVVWFENDTKLKRDLFPAAVLELHDPKLGPIQVVIDRFDTDL